MVYFLRLIIGFALMAVVAALLIPVLMVRPRHRSNMAMASHWVSHTCKWIWGVRFEIEGEEYLTPSKPTIYICNHQDTLDMFFAPVMIRSGVVTLGKWELLYIPIIGWVYWLAGNIPIKRNKKLKAQAALNRVAHILTSQNMSVLIFPEGTRNWGKPLPFKLGAFKLAIAAEADIVPVAFSLRHKTLSYSRWRAGTIKVRALPPLSTRGLTEDHAIDLAITCRHLIESQAERISQSAKSSGA